MIENQGYYSLIQYSEYPERIEYVNVGICLFSMMAPRVLVKFSHSPKRAEQMFGVDLGVHFSLIKESINNRIQSEFSSSWSKSSLEKFIGLRSGKVRLSPAFSVLVRDSEETLERLFNKLVVDMPMRVRAERIATKLKRGLQFQQVEELLEHPDSVMLPQGPTIKAPYAYQNGAYNLICPVSLVNDPDVAMRNAGKFAIEGKWLNEFTEGLHPKRLVIVGDLSGQKDDFSNAVEKVMKEYGIGFYRMDNLDPLAEDIRLNAREHGIRRSVLV